MKTKQYLRRIMGVEILYPIINRATAPIKSVNIDDLSSQLNRTFMFYLSLVFAVTITIRLVSVSLSGWFLFHYQFGSFNRTRV